MSKALTSKTDAKSSKAGKTASPTTTARLFVLDLGGGRVMSCNPDGSDLKTIVTEARKLPDGIVVDVEAGHIYWTNMGSVGANNGSIFRADLGAFAFSRAEPRGGSGRSEKLAASTLYDIFRLGAVTLCLEAAELIRSPMVTKVPRSPVMPPQAVDSVNSANRSPG